LDGQESLKKYIRLVLKEWSKKIPQDKRGLLLIDGYSAQLDKEIEDMLREIRIDIEKLPSHTTAYLQPMDISVNSPFKHHYAEFWDTYQFTNSALTKKGNFKAPSRGEKVIWISKSWEKVTSETISNGFHVYTRDLTEEELQECVEEEDISQKAKDDIEQKDKNQDKVEGSNLPDNLLDEENNTGSENEDDELLERFMNYELVCENETGLDKI